MLVAGAVLLTAGRTHHEVALIQPGPEAVAPPPQPCFDVSHSAVKVGDSLEELRDADRMLTQAGVHIVDTVDHSISRAVLVQGPDGNLVEVFVDTGTPWRGDPTVFATGLPKPLCL